MRNRMIVDTPHVKVTRDIAQVGCGRENEARRVPQNGNRTLFLGVHRDKTLGRLPHSFWNHGTDGGVNTRSW